MNKIAESGRAVRSVRRLVRRAWSCAPLCAIVFSLSVTMSALVAGVARAQPAAQPAQKTYPTLDPAVTDARQLRQLRSQISAALRLGSLDQATRDLLKRYIEQGIFANMTRPVAWSDPGLFPRWRRELIGMLQYAARRPSDHQFVRDVIFTAAKQVASGPYHPAARYNAVLIIGELNEQELRRRGTNVTPPVPYRPARDYLITLLEDQQTPEELQIAALIGLKRHAAALAAAGQMDDRLLILARGILQQTTPPAGTTAAAHYWKQRLAAEILGAGGQAQDAPLIASLLGNPDAPRSVRCAAAEALGQLDYSGASADMKPLVKAISAFALGEVQDAVQWLNDEVAKLPPDDGLRRGPVDLSERPQEPQEDPLVARTRRHMGYVIWCATRGLAGMLATVQDDAQKQTITAIGKQLQTLMKALQAGGSDVTPRDLLKQIGAPAIRLEQLVKGL